MKLRLALIPVALVGFAVSAQGQDGSIGIVAKKIFAMPTYTTVSGTTLGDVRVGWEAYGQLNATRDNVIIVPHFITGNSHAAGKYKADDAAPGYWDPIIGPDKPIDTNRFYVVSVDSLVNLNTKDPNTTTTGPATINPDTGKPWGMSFPIVTMRDFVNVQKALLDSLGVTRVHAAIGASMGSMQALEWAAAYPDMVQRVVPVIAATEADAWTIGRVELWGQAITLDPNWNNGDYYGKAEPVAGLALALKLVTLDARHWGWADKAFGRKLAKEGENPLMSWNNKYAIAAALDAAGTARARSGDANHFLYLVRAHQLFMTGHDGGGLEAGLARIKAKALFLSAKSDLLLVPDNARRAVATLKKLGKQAELVEIDGDGGHLDGVLAVARVGAQLRRFLD